MQFTVNLSKYIPDKLALLAMMVVEADFVVIDPRGRSLVFDDGFVLPMAMLGIHPDNADPVVPEDTEFIFNFIYEIK